MDARTEQKLFTAVTIAADLIVINASFLAAYWLRFSLLPVRFGVPPLQPYINALGVVSAVYLLVFRRLGFYNPRRGRLSAADEFYSAAVGSSLAILILVGITFFYRDFEYSRLLIIIAWGISSLVLGITRTAAWKLQNSLMSGGIGAMPVIIAGTGKIAGFMEEKINNHPGLGYKILGFLRDGRDEVDAGKVLGDITELESVCARKGAKMVIIALSQSTHDIVVDIVKRCYRAGVAFRIVSDLFEIVTGRIVVEAIDGVPVFGLGKEGLEPWEKFLKRSVDVGVSSVALVLTGPVFAACAILIKLTSRGPVFFKQERMGQEGRSFTIYKFRSMHINAEESTGPVWATGSDSRRTRVGYWLRRFSMDELPQLWCVLKGDMSIVGPRPERPVFVEEFAKQIPRYMERHRVKPGMTGYSQVSGFRGDTSIMERTRFDLYYIDNWSLFFDFKIIVKTAFEFIFHKHAY